MTLRRQGKMGVLLMMTVIYLYASGNSFSKWRNKKVGETQSTKSAYKMSYPSVSLIPRYELGFSKSRLSAFKTRKNLTEYNLNTTPIASNIISINQSYELSNG